MGGCDCANTSSITFAPACTFHRQTCMFVSLDDRATSLLGPGAGLMRAESPLGIGVGLNLAQVGAGPANPVPATEAEIAKLRAIFDSIDKDASNGLSEFELKAAMEKAGRRTISSGELKTMMEEADKDQNGVIDFQEFCLMYGRSVEIEKEEAGGELYDCFRVMDRDGSGFLERDELMQISACTHAPRAPASPRYRLLLYPAPTLRTHPAPFSSLESSLFLPCSDQPGHGDVPCPRCGRRGRPAGGRRRRRRRKDAHIASCSPLSSG